MNNYNKYLKYKQKYLDLKKLIGGETVFNINRSAFNPMPNADDNCGPLVLHTLDILDERQTKLISERCESSHPKRFLDQGITSKLLVDFIKKSKKTKPNSIYINREILKSQFNTYWHEYAKGLLKQDGSNGLLVRISINNGYGHYIVIINYFNTPYIIDKHKTSRIKYRPIPFDDYFQYKTFKKYNTFDILEDSSEQGYRRYISGIYPTIVDLVDELSPDGLLRQPSGLRRQPSKEFERETFYTAEDNALIEHSIQTGILNSITCLYLYPDLSNKNFKSIESNAFDSLLSIKTLNLTDNQLTLIPESIGLLTNLNTLFLSHNQLILIPESIGFLTNLNTLELQKNQLISLPDLICLLTNLIRLIISDNQLTSLPESIGILTNLMRLSISNNQLTSLPESIGFLINLTLLNIHKNQLTSLPDSIGTLTKLKNLNISNNQLTSLPESIGTLIELTELYLSNNKLISIPESISTLTNLDLLYLSKNQIILVPESISILINLTIKICAVDEIQSGPYEKFKVRDLPRLKMEN